MYLFSCRYHNLCQVKVCLKVNSKKTWMEIEKRGQLIQWKINHWYIYIYIDRKSINAALKYIS